MTSAAVKLTRTAVCAVFLAAVPSFAQNLAPRLSAGIDNSSRVTLPDSHSPRALAANDLGKVPDSLPLTDINLVFSETAAQQADLLSLLAAQQNPASPLYHQWLTPEQFAARFGMADSDIATAESWLQQQGFTINGVSRSHTRISFSGTAAQVHTAFGAELHYYKSAADTQAHFAAATDLTLPSALASSVLGITHLSSFRPTPHIIKKGPVPANPDFTSGQTGSHFLQPGDVAVIYDINAAYNAGYTGANQSIAIIGQSAVIASDISNFQTAAGVPVRAPNEILVPNSGAAATYTDDEAESDLDLEYSSSIAKGAAIYFVYTGNSDTAGVFAGSLQYVIDNDLAPIVSSSYGACEPLLGGSEFSSLNQLLQQAVSQGQTVVSAAGDSGSTDCSGETNTAAISEGLAVDFPASSQYVTGLGGTEFPAADVTTTNSTYWNSNGTNDVITSAKSYIPEQVWNDDSPSYGLSSGGGGASIYAPRPSWQTGVPGIPAGSFRLVPDISLDSSPNDAGYLYCSSDTSTGVTGSCANGFRDSNNQYLTVAGGTSFAAPIFAGMLAIINQAKNYNAGQGVVNPVLYTLASSPATYASAFHDITAAGNQCLAGSSYCGTGAAVTNYAATTGYDEASGLGSVDLYNLLTAWPQAVGGVALAGSITTLSAPTASPAIGASDTVTITVAASSGGVTPTGTVSLSVDGSVVNPALPLVNGTATYTFSSSVAGSHVVSATYSGDTLHRGSTGTINLNVGSVSFSLAVPNVSIAAGASGVVTVTVTPINGYNGTVEFGLSGGAGFSNACATGPSFVSLTSGAAQTAQFTFYTNLATCEALGLSTGGASGLLRKYTFAASTPSSTGTAASLAGEPALPASPAGQPWKHAPLPAALAGLLLACCFGRRSRRLRGALGISLVLLLGVAAASLAGCGSQAVNVNSGSGGGGSSNNSPVGTYTLTVTGTDSVNPAISASTNFTVTIH